MFQSHVSTQFWFYNVKYVRHLINHTPILLLKNFIYFENLYDKKCDLNNICVLECLCYLGTITTNRKKLDTRATPILVLDLILKDILYII